MKKPFTILLFIISLQSNAQNRPVASTPPLGWNSYTGYSTAATEDELIKNIDAVSDKLKPYGYQYVTVDNGWFTDKPPEKEGKVMIDEYGRPESSAVFFPDGVKYVISYVHKKGLKFGIWLISTLEVKPGTTINIPADGCAFISYKQN